MKIKKLPGKIPLLFAVIAAPVFVFGSKYAQISEIIPSKNIEVDKILSDISLPLPNILDKLGEKDDELAKINVSIGPREITYYENRYTLLSYKTQAECGKRKGLWDEKNYICKAVIRKKTSDKEAVIGLKLLNTETKEVQVIAVQTKITINGVSIVAPNGYQIEIVERPNGIRWNWWNTSYRVAVPENMVVIKNNFPREEIIPTTRIVKGKPKKETRKVIKGFLYVPHSEYFEREENMSVLVSAGASYLKRAITQAFLTLKERGVSSRVFPDKLVADIEALSPRFFERLPLLEQGDFTEFQIDPRKTVERVLIILGANRENAWMHTCNRSDACGWVQFTPRTYSDISKFYPAAGIENDFRAGAGNHINSIMAAILLHDNNLAALIKKFGDGILDDPDLDKYLASSYNGAPKLVHNSLNATILKGFTDWVNILSPTRKDSKGVLRKETRDFMTKLDYLIKNDLP